MSLNRGEKEVLIGKVSHLAATAQTLVMAEYRGLSVSEMDRLRTTARHQGVSLSVVKNTLVKRAVAATDFAIIADQMTGPLIYGFSEDPVAAAKVMDDFAKTHEKLIIRNGVYAGKILDAHGVKQLASIPSKEVLLSQLLGLMNAPVSALARVLHALGEQKNLAQPV